MKINWLWQDVRYTVRNLTKHPEFTLLAVLTLGLGIGATTIGFGVVENILFDPYPYKGANRLTTLTIHDVKVAGNMGRSALSVAEFLEYQKENHVFEDMAGSYDQNIVYTGNGAAQQFLGAYVTPNTFQFFGIQPLLGRGITPEDGNPDAQPVFVMNYKLWKEQFGGDANILGTAFTLNGEARVLVGIMPPRFQAYGVSVWLPLVMKRSGPNEAQALPYYLWVIGRRKPGISMEAAAADLTLVAQEQAKVHPKDYPAKFTVLTRGLNEFVMGDFRTVLITLMTAVLMLLLIACSNVANLLLARATTRDREVAIRAAIGASRQRLLVQFFVESFVLSLAGAAVGVLFAYYGLAATVAYIPRGPLPDEAVIGLNPAVLLLTLSLTTITTFICGLAPALHAVRGGLRERLNQNWETGTGFWQGKFRSLLVIVEVSLSVVLLVGASLMLRSVIILTRVDLGFNPSQILYTAVVPATGQNTNEQKKPFFQQALQRIKALPGVTAAAETSTQPPLGGFRSPMVVLGQSDPATRRTAMFDLCSEGYFETMGVQLQRGSLFTSQDVDSARPVAVVNQTLARNYFGKDDPIGQKIKLMIFDRIPDAPHDTYFEIIGVVSDFRNQGLHDPTMPEAFLPFTISGMGNRAILTKTTLDPNGMLPKVREAIQATNAGVAVSQAGSIEELLELSAYKAPRFALLSLSIFAGIGLTLILVGVFSVMSYNVLLEKHEIGIRMALGAERSKILQGVIRKGLRLIVIGIFLGLLASYSFTHFLASLIKDISPLDPWTLSVVAAIMVIVGFSACLLPALRATKVDPLIAIRYD